MYTLTQLGPSKFGATTNINVVTVFAVIRNEIARLPTFFSHHRAIGINRFVIVDNGSTDGSIEFLANQRDCNLYSTVDKFGDPVHGKTAWLNHLSDKYSNDAWCLILDADEHLIYENSENISISEFLVKINEEEADAVFGFLLDLFPSTFKKSTTSNSKLDALELKKENLYYDNTYRFVTTKPGIRPETIFPGIEVLGGVRHRIFNDHIKRNIFRKLKFEALHFTIALCKWLKFRNLEQSIRKAHLLAPPTLRKVPLFIKRHHNQVLHGAHSITAGKIYSRNLVLLHYKLLDDFGVRLDKFAKHGQHWNQGLEQKWLHNRLNEYLDGSLLSSESVQYINSHTLVSQGIIRDLLN